MVNPSFFLCSTWDEVKPWDKSGENLTIFKGIFFATFFLLLFFFVSRFKTLISIVSSSASIIWLSAYCLTSLTLFSSSAILSDWGFAAAGTEDLTSFFCFLFALTTLRSSVEVLPKETSCSFLLSSIIGSIDFFVIFLFLTGFFSSESTATSWTSVIVGSSICFDEVFFPLFAICSPYIFFAML